MELRHYSNAIETLNECITISDNLLSDSYFRKSQARFFNKNSKEEDLLLSLADIKKAIKINSDSKLYKTHQESILKMIEVVKENNCMKINCKFFFLKKFLAFLNEAFDSYSKTLVKFIHENSNKEKDEDKINVYNSISSDGNKYTINNNLIDELIFLDSRNININNNINSVNKNENNLKNKSNTKNFKFKSKSKQEENESDLILQYEILKE